MEGCMSDRKSTLLRQWSSLIVVFAGLVVVAPSLHAQAAYTAERTTRIQAGFGFLALNPDYRPGNIIGLSAWGDYDFSKYVGAEISTHFAEFITPDDLSENSYMIGPRLIYRHKRLTAYGKVLVGRATITNQQYNLSSSYNMYALGGGLEYRLGRRFNVRLVDFEQQEWPDFAPHTLAPTAMTFGVSYILH